LLEQDFAIKRKTFNFKNVAILGKVLGKEKMIMTTPCTKDNASFK
jgi:hypothetical protein